MNRIATVMTERDRPPGPSGDMIAHTKTSEPDIKVIVRPWYVMILVRVARVYIQTLIGLLGADAVLAQLDFNGFTQVLLAAAFPAFMSLLQNSAEILTSMDTNEYYSTYRA